MGKLGKISSAYTQSYMNNINNRIFALAAYLLGVNEYSFYAYIDCDYEFSAPLQYYPEYDIDIGDPLDFPNNLMDLLNGDLIIRNFERGKIIINPFKDGAVIQISEKYSKVIPHGGGLVDINGNYDGYLEYQEILPGPLNITAETAMILVATSLMPGDVNGDGQVNIQDIRACVDHILEVQDYGVSADVNGDSAVNVLDVQEIVNIMGGV